MNKYDLYSLYLAKLDTEMFLDTHPNDVAAKEYLSRVIRAITEAEAMRGGM